jgi:hypothetical protein
MNRAQRHARSLDDNADRLHRIAANLERIDDRLRSWSTGVTTGGDGPRSHGSHSDPTATAATRRDRFAAQRRQLAELVHTIDRHVAELHALALEVLAPAAEPKPADRGIPRCANPHGCPADNYADPGRRGRCEACYRHLVRHDRDRREETRR